MEYHLLDWQELRNDFDGVNSEVSYTYVLSGVNGNPPLQLLTVAYLSLSPIKSSIIISYSIYVFKDVASLQVHLRDGNDPKVILAL